MTGAHVVLGLIAASTLADCTAEKGGGASACFGHVRDAESGRAIAGASVALFYRPKTPSFAPGPTGGVSTLFGVVETDEDGAFTFRGVPGGAMLSLGVALPGITVDWRKIERLDASKSDHAKVFWFRGREVKVGGESRLMLRAENGSM